MGVSCQFFQKQSLPEQDAHAAAKQPISPRQKAYQPPKSKTSSATPKPKPKPTPSPTVKERPIDTDRPLANVTETPESIPEPPVANSSVWIREDNANRIIDADGSSVTISGDDGLILITGACDSLTISGSRNQVQCDTVENIDISGNGNTLAAASLGGGVLSGDNNKVNWSQGLDGLPPVVESLGASNRVDRQQQ